jgi:predicted GNAT family N-acyltransferase
MRRGSSPQSASPPAAAAVEIRWASGPEDMPGAIAVREEVFCCEQGVPKDDELDGLDDEAHHIVALAPDGRTIGTARLLVHGEQAKIGRVAVERDWRRKGVASRMLELALAGAREHGCRSARLAAQLQATSLYEQSGFAVQSEPFEEAGIQHVWMGRPL